MGGRDSSDGSLPTPVSGNKKTELAKRGGRGGVKERPKAKKSP